MVVWVFQREGGDGREAAGSQPGSDRAVCRALDQGFGAHRVARRPYEPCALGERGQVRRDEKVPRLNPLDPDYGATPVDDEDARALIPAAREVLGEPLLMASLYDLEQTIEARAIADLLAQVYAGTLSLLDILDDHFLRELHARMFGDVWTWAGRFRTKDRNIGVPSEAIAVELRTSIETIRYRWEHTDDWGARELGMAVHAETVRIHPFVDGNGRATRRLADLVFAAAQDDDEWLEYDWDIDKRAYIHMLRRYDATRDSSELAANVPVIPVAGE